MKYVCLFLLATSALWAQEDGGIILEPLEYPKYPEYRSKANPKPVEPKSDLKPDAKIPRDIDIDDEELYQDPRYDSIETQRYSGNFETPRNKLANDPSGENSDDETQN